MPTWMGWIEHAVLKEGSMSFSSTKALLLVPSLGAFFFACQKGDPATPPEGNGDSGPAVSAEPSVPSYEEIVLPAEPQRPGDPDAGYRALLNEAYVPCGVPYSAYSSVYGVAPESDRVPGREGLNAELAYDLTAYKTPGGVQLVTSNCLTCHAGRINGKLVVGLGDANRDFTLNQTATAEGVGLLISDPAERAEWRKWADRIAAIAPWAVLDTVGVNPADSFTGVLFAHHEPKTLAWSKTPLIALPATPVVLPVDVPPWWRMKKKNAMFYNGEGRGDHARFMMTASILCTSSVEESRAIDRYFPDIRAWITSLSPPAYPYPVDAALAGKGRSVFERTCSRCHGRYGEPGSYPNKVIPLEEIGTDPALVLDQAEFSAQFATWYKESFFGETSRLEPQRGYIAPPLDGIWATAPYLHNGSVPTVLALLDSKSRPQFWTRSGDSNDYDPQALGWRHTPLDHGKDGEKNSAAKKRLYDTSRDGYRSTGHTFGDALTDEDRGAVLEYLKTL